MSRLGNLEKYFRGSGQILLWCPLVVGVWGSGEPFQWSDSGLGYKWEDEAADGWV